VYHAVVDERDGTIHAAANHAVYGPRVRNFAGLPVQALYLRVVRSSCRACGLRGDEGQARVRDPVELGLELVDQVARHVWAARDWRCRGA